jgi:hypothetical protein
MKKALLLLLVVSCSIFGFSSETFAQNKNSPDVKSKLVAEVENVTFDKTDVNFLCPVSGSYCSKDNVNVKVATSVRNAGNEKWTYYYFVSGGKIVGEKANVVWDLLNAKIGKHTLTVGIGRNNLIPGQIITKSISLQECPDCDPGCACPAVEISGPTKNVAPGDSIIFTASVTGGEENIEPSYNWTVSGGTITTGQGTRNIIVKTDSAVKKGSVTATLELGNLCTSCPLTKATQTVTVAENKP